MMVGAHHVIMQLRLNLPTFIYIQKESYTFSADKQSYCTVFFKEIIKSKLSFNKKQLWQPISVLFLYLTRNNAGQDLFFTLSIINGMDCEKCSLCELGLEGAKWNVISEVKF